VHNDGSGVKIEMFGVVAIDNWAYQTAALVYVEQANDDYNIGEAFVKI
jgi:hypothetical protein